MAARPGSSLRAAHRDEIDLGALAEGQIDRSLGFETQFLRPQAGEQEEADSEDSEDRAHRSRPPSTLRSSKRRRRSASFSRRFSSRRSMRRFT